MNSSSIFDIGFTLGITMVETIDIVGGAIATLGIMIGTSLCIIMGADNIKGSADNDEECSSSDKQLLSSSISSYSTLSNLSSTSLCQQDAFDKECSPPNDQLLPDTVEEFLPSNDHLLSDTDEEFSSPNDQLLSSSITSHSTSSSLSSSSDYEQEAFDTYKLKVIQLCHEIGFGEPSNVERMAGGSYNRVMGLKFSGESEDQHYVLRIPRVVLEDEEARNILDQVAVIMHLQQYDLIPIPSIAALDTTTDNAIKSQYVLQRRLPGQPISSVYHDASLSEKLQITTLVADLLVKMDSLNPSHTGRLASTRSLPWVAHDVSLSHSHIQINGFRRNDFSDFPLLKPQNLYNTLLDIFEVRKEENLEWPDMTKRCEDAQRIVREMENHGLFRKNDDSNVVWHWDISTNNVLLDQVNTQSPRLLEKTEAQLDESKTSPDIVIDEGLPDIEQHSESSDSGLGQESNEWVISGVLDWDDALSVPRVIAREPPSWLWVDDNERGLGWDGDRSEPLQRNLTTEENLIKTHFDRIMQGADPEWYDDTYVRGPWVRRMFKFALYSFEDEYPVQKFDKFKEDWAAYLQEC
ncbi:hypothetical protein NHQ30_003478 [Ciborinia camelliae]|nr:hypothetical protein NHQ30_003478 [Ciborinia camelliae]